jgi:hypothetical protein
MVAGGLRSELTKLKWRNPQGYGYLVRYWEDAKQGLDNTTKNYASVKHIHGNVENPQTSTQGLGKTLSLLTELDVLTVHSRRSNATIYDLTTYNPARLSLIGDFLTGE